jgi:hypothetical protein
MAAGAGESADKRTETGFIEIIVVAAVATEGDGIL